MDVFQRKAAQGGWWQDKEKRCYLYDMKESIFSTSMQVLFMYKCHHKMVIFLKEDRKSVV